MAQPYMVRQVRTPSISSDIQSVRSVPGSLSAVPAVNPQPAYIASRGASELVSTETGSTVSVSEPALVLLNNFLDQILFNILSTAHSVNLGQLKATVPTVLKPRLGKAALQAAEEELREYLEDSDDEESHRTNGTFELKSDFDLDFAWKLARLRCMVYMTLGDMEEEDEEEIVEQEQLHKQNGDSQRSVYLGPASAIFLTSVLEYLGEQALFYAAQHAQKRSQASKTPGLSLEQEADTADGSEILVLEEADMFQVGRESPLSRLWRSWRRNMRAPRESASRPLSPETAASPSDAPGATRSRKNSMNGGTPIKSISEQPQSLGQVLEATSPSQMPLPMSDRDVDEIEVPGLAPEIVDDESEQTPTPVPERSKRRPTSLLMGAGDSYVPISPMTPTRPRPPVMATAQKPKTGRTRSSSTPMPTQTSFGSTRIAKVQDAASVEQTEPVATADASPEESTGGDADGAVATGEEAGGLHKTDEEKSDLPKSSESAISGDADHEQLGKVAAAVSAVAGALGLGALTATATHDAKETKQVKQPKTVAEEFLGPTSDVSPPRDAVTGASITSVGDFDSIHVPIERPPPGKETISPPDAEASDPEDLALSSGDDEPANRGRDVNPASSERHVEHEKQDSAAHGQSALGETSFYHDADEVEESSPEEARMVQGVTGFVNPEQPSRRANRDGVIFEQSDVPETAISGQHPKATSSQEIEIPAQRVAAPILPSSHQSVTVPADASRPNTAFVDSESARSLVSSAGAHEVFVDSQSRPGTARSAVIPERLSSASTKTVGHLYANSKTSQYSHHSKSSSSSSKLLGFDREQHARSQQSSRAGADTPLDAVNGITGRHSLGAGTAKEQSPTATSPKSPKRHLRLRSGTEENRGGTSPADPVDEAKKRSLEVLIKSDETLHYTLTPVSARGDQFPIPEERVTQAQDLADFLRNTRPPNEESAHPRTALSLVTGSHGHKSNASQPESSSYAVPVTKVIPSSKNLPSPPPKSPKVKSMMGPRDPRVDQSSSTRDLADYARSTGPESVGQLPKALSPSGTSTVSVAGIAAATAYTRSTTQTIESDRPPPTAHSVASSVPKTPTQPVSRLKYQARDPRPSRTRDTTDLIDFIREGPPRQPGDHRIDRNVAPFRRTMDSEDLNALAPERNQNGPGSATSTQDSSVAGRSVQDSMNSRTALLDSANRSNARQANGFRPAAASTARQTQPVDAPMPKRTQRRVRDPYAIEDSDEELDEELATAKPKRQEESLIDFLRNTAPPPGMMAQPVVAANSTMAASSKVRKEPSNSALNDRSLRKTPSAGVNRNANLTRSGALGPSGTDSPPGYHRATNGAREESPHLSQVGSKYDSYRPTQPTHAGHVERNRQKRGPVGEPRDARPGGDTRDLAAYLKDSGPAAPAADHIQPFPAPIKEEAGFLKFFARRRSVKK